MRAKRLLMLKMLKRMTGTMMIALKERCRMVVRRVFDGELCHLCWSCVFWQRLQLRL